MQLKMILISRRMLFWRYKPESKYGKAMADTVVVGGITQEVSMKEDEGQNGRLRSLITVRSAYQED